MAVVSKVYAPFRYGASSYFWQRFSAVVLLLYTLWVVAFLVSNPGLGYFQWVAFFHSRAMQVFSTLALVLLVLHAAIGLWAVGTDYLTQRQLGPRGRWVQRLYSLAVNAGVVFYLIWGTTIIWGL